MKNWIIKLIIPERDIVIYSVGSVVLVKLGNLKNIPKLKLVYKLRYSKSVFWLQVPDICCHHSNRWLWGPQSVHLRWLFLQLGHQVSAVPCSSKNKGLHLYLHVFLMLCLDAAPHCQQNCSLLGCDIVCWLISSLRKNMFASIFMFEVSRIQNSGYITADARPTNILLVAIPICIPDQILTYSTHLLFLSTLSHPLRG